MIATESKRERAELFTWRFGTALARTTPVARTIETHFADIYDEVRIYLDDPQAINTPACCLPQQERQDSSPWIARW
jgi:hypothetical protein